MRLPRIMAHYNRLITNRFLGPVAAKRSRSFGLVHHVGRKSGKPYANPVRLLVADDEHVVIPAMYGLDSDWIRNVLAAGQLTLTRKGHDTKVADIHVVTDPDQLPGLEGKASRLGKAMHLEGFVVGRPTS